MPTIQEYKQRVLCKNHHIDEDKEHWGNVIMDINVIKGTFMFIGVIDLTMRHTMTAEDVNKYLRMVINIPTMAATDKGMRRVLIHNTSYCMAHQSDIIDPELKEVLEQYFEWLKERDDYVESPEDEIVRIEKERITARAKAVKQELIETLYHPDRCEKMYEIYGEIWAETQKMPTIQEHKQRVLSKNHDANEENQGCVKILNANFKFHLGNVINLKLSHGMTIEEVNEYLRNVINVPTVAARDKYMRELFIHTSSYFMARQSDIIDQELKEVLEQYFDWLKERDDYVE